MMENSERINDDENNDNDKYNVCDDNNRTTRLHLCNI